MRLFRRKPVTMHELFIDAPDPEERHTKVGKHERCRSAFFAYPFNQRCQRDIAASYPHQHRAEVFGTKYSADWMDTGLSPTNPFEAARMEQETKEWLDQQ